MFSNTPVTLKLNVSMFYVSKYYAITYSFWKEPHMQAVRLFMDWSVLLDLLSWRWRRRCRSWWTECCSRRSCRWPGCVRRCSRSLRTRKSGYETRLQICRLLINRIYESGFIYWSTRLIPYHCVIVKSNSKKMNLLEHFFLSVSLK